MVNLWGEYLFSVIVLNDDIAALSINKYFDSRLHHNEDMLHNFFISLSV